jgi:hypothetical protein
MGEVSLGGHDSLENQRDVPRSSNLMQLVSDDVLAEIFQAGTSMCNNPDRIHPVDVDNPQVLPFPHLVSSVSWRRPPAYPN